MRFGGGFDMYFHVDFCFFSFFILHRHSDAFREAVHVFGGVGKKVTAKMRGPVGEHARTIGLVGIERSERCCIELRGWCGGNGNWSLALL
jgi:hypothetical protein